LSRNVGTQLPITLRKILEERRSHLSLTLHATVSKCSSGRCIWTGIFH